jgi:hypothetical protein
VGFAKLASIILKAEDDKIPRSIKVLGRLEFALQIRHLQRTRPVKSRMNLFHPHIRPRNCVEAARSWSEWQDLPSSLSTIDFISFFSALARFGGRGGCT